MKKRVCVLHVGLIRRPLMEYQQRPKLQNTQRWQIFIPLDLVYCCQFKSTRLIPIFLYMLCICLVLDTGAEIRRALGGLGANQRRKSFSVHKESCVTLLTNYHQIV